MSDVTLEDLQRRLQRLEDESAIQRLIMSYGPAADAAMAEFAGHLWSDDGVYDWDANGEPHVGSAAVAAMLRTDAHLGLVDAGVAHFAGPLMIELDGDAATAINYSIIMRREDNRYFVWRVSAVRWDVARNGASWRVQRRTNRLLDATGAGSTLFGAALNQLFPKGPQ